MALKSALFLLSALPFITADAFSSSNFASTPIHDLIHGATPLLSKRQSGHDVDPSTLYPAYNLSVPIDHFFNESKYEPHSSGTFKLRYWFDATYYKAGGPVIMLESGEDTGVDRLSYLQKGILHDLAMATNGIGVVLEHRYYGTSIPTSDLSTESLRFLTTEQALADTAYFAENVVFEGMADRNLTASDTPWIAYGGSYAGAFVAFLRVQYPSTFFGAISSSGVTEATYDFWEYYSPVAQYGPPECILNTQKLTNVVDNILINEGSNTTLVNKLKNAFGLGGMTYLDDFTNVLSGGVGAWQGRNWDPAINDPTFSYYCGNISTNQTLYQPSVSQLATVVDLLDAADYGSDISLIDPMLNYIGWINTTQVVPCIEGGETVDQCFSTHNQTFYSLDDISQTWRSWPYQYCSQWGFLQTGSGVPAGVLPLISRTINLQYESVICQDAFNITTPANTGIINAYGGYNISYGRLAIIDGEIDPWRGATPHAPEAPARTSTTQEPFILISGAVHHWDENGVFQNETKTNVPPSAVSQTQSQEEVFVLAWLKEWQSSPQTSK